MSREEVERCEWTYEFAGKLYGISKEEIDKLLKTGNAIVIVNISSMQVINGVEKGYPKNFMSVIVYQDFDKQKWINNMRRAGRVKKEIESRMKNFGVL